MLNIKAMEHRALMELKETQDKVIKDMVDVCEESIYKELKDDVAVNQKITAEFYEVVIPFNVKNSQGFSTNRIPSNGLTAKEIMEKVAEVLEKEGYTTEFVENNVGEKSNLQVKLIVNEQ